MYRPSLGWIESRAGYIHWASKENYHFFRATLTKIYRIKINHKLDTDNTPYETHLKTQIFLRPNGEKCSEITRCHLKKNHRNCSPSGLRICHGQKPGGGYITRYWNLMNSYWRFWIGGLLWRFWASCFCDFWHFLLFNGIIPLNFQMCFIRSTLVFLCRK